MSAIVTGRSAPILAAVVCAVFANALAAGDDKKGQSYDVSAWAIRASKSNNEVSPELKPIVKDLKKRFNYTGFKLEWKKQSKTSEGKALSIDLTAGFKAQVTPLERKGNRVKLKIEVTKREGEKDKPLLNTTVGLDRGKFHLQGGWKIDSKSADVLIVAVSAR